MDIGESGGADELLSRGSAEQPALVVEAESIKIRIGGERARHELFAVVEHRAILRAAPAQEIVEGGCAHGVVRGQMECATALERFGHVDSEVSQVKSRAGRRAVHHPQRARRDTDTPIEGEFPPLDLDGAGTRLRPARERDRQRQRQREPRAWNVQPRHGAPPDCSPCSSYVPTLTTRLDSERRRRRRARTRAGRAARTAASRESEVGEEGPGRGARARQRAQQHRANRRVRRFDADCRDPDRSRIG